MSGESLPSARRGRLLRVLRSWVRPKRNTLEVGHQIKAASADRSEGESEVIEAEAVDDDGAVVEGISARRVEIFPRRFANQRLPQGEQ